MAIPSNCGKRITSGRHICPINIYWCNIFSVNENSYLLIALKTAAIWDHSLRGIVNLDVFRTMNFPGRNMKANTTNIINSKKESRQSLVRTIIYGTQDHGYAAGAIQASTVMHPTELVDFSLPFLQMSWIRRTLLLFLLLLQRIRIFRKVSPVCAEFCH